MYCTNCGNKINDSEKYCPYCGEPVLKEESIKKETSTNNSNISTILGILSCVFFMVPLVSIPLAIISIVTGINQKKKSNKFVVGILLGIISIILTVVIVSLTVWAFVYAIDNINDTKDNDYQIDDIIDNFNDFYKKQTEKFDIKGYSWLADDNSILYLNSDNTYTWYEKEEISDDNYYKGHFKTYQGEQAIQYIASTLKEFGVTEEEQRRLFQNEFYDIDDYYLIILTCETAKIEGTEKNDVAVESYYYGFYSKIKKRLDLVNMSTANKVGFTQKEKISNIDV